MCSNNSNDFSILSIDLIKNLYYDYFLGIFMYKCVHKLSPAEPNTCTWIAFVKDSHSYNARLAFSNYLTIPLPNSNLLKRNLIYAGTTNGCPETNKRTHYYS